MRAAVDWQDYTVWDTSGGEKLEQWGDVVLVRPDPQVIWNTPRKLPLWQKPHARYLRSAKGGGAWENYRKFPTEWVISYKELRFKVSPTGFKHTGLFPEQAVNWDFLHQLIVKENRPLSVLNLFAYTGGATLACAKAGAKVCHVDASKGVVGWARENARLSGILEDRIRYIVDDCQKFLQREIRRGNVYDIVILDPPSYGRGPAGEIWKLEDSIYDLMELCSKVLSKDAKAVLLNSYTTGLSPSVMAYVLASTIGKNRKGSVSADEIGLPVKDSGLYLPCGSTAIWQA